MMNRVWNRCIFFVMSRFLHALPKDNKGQVNTYWSLWQIRRMMDFQCFKTILWAAGLHSRLGGVGDPLEGSGIVWPTRDDPFPTWTFFSHLSQLECQRMWWSMLSWKYFVHCNMPSKWWRVQGTLNTLTQTHRAVTQQLCPEHIEATGAITSRTTDSNRWTSPSPAQTHR